MTRKPREVASLGHEGRGAFYYAVQSTMVSEQHPPLLYFSKVCPSAPADQNHANKPTPRPQPLALMRRILTRISGVVNRDAATRRDRHPAESCRDVFSSPFRPASAPYSSAQLASDALLRVSQPSL
jgi:hypothetical protein